jgi:hypothetical protein
MLSNESDNHRNFHEKVWGTFRFSLDLALFQEFLMCIQGFNGNSLAENGVYIDQIAKKVMSFAWSSRWHFQKYFLPERVFLELCAIK